MSIEDWRARIDEVDGELLRLLNRRARLAARIGALKRHAGLPLLDAVRERDVIARACRDNRGPLDDSAVVEIFRRVIIESRRVEERAETRDEGLWEGLLVSDDSTIEGARIAFQGERGAFSEEAAFALLGERIRPVPRPTFESLFDAIGEGVADFALAPIENSLAGTVQQTYDLLVESNLTITAEVIRPITHNLIGCAGARLESVGTIESHPVALAQCERFFAERPHVRRVASDDTAASVRRVVERGDPTRAAIASARAAHLYGGTILRERMEDHSENYTRFLLLAPTPRKDARGDKLSLVIRPRHEPGALYAALEPLARRRIDLLKIESRPIHGEPWQYRFYLDLRATADEPRVVEALAELRLRVEELKLLGCYVSARATAAKLELKHD
jgi:prephenate dehydratase/chorismate mutase